MALYVLGDTHLSLGGSKPMDIFPGWDGYVERLERNWRKLITPQDTIVLAGDISWAMRLTDTRKDFEFLQQLPGQKLIMKGNHDYWWTTANKMNAYLKAEGFDTLHILHNNSYTVEGYALCGTRGWLFDVGEPHDEKVMNREIGRLKMSLDAAEPGLSALSAGLHWHQRPGDRGDAEGIRHQALFLRSSARQRHPVCSAGECGRHPIQARQRGWAAFLPVPHQLKADRAGKKNKKSKFGLAIVSKACYNKL